ncbi:MAG: helix-turn-helix transcriptional regulator [Dehalococcoidia bacterium]
MVGTEPAFAEWLTEERLRRGMGPTAFARLLGVSHQSVINWTERGVQPREDQVIRVAQKLAVETVWLLQIAGHPVGQPPVPKPGPAAVAPRGLALFERGELPDEAWAELEDFAAYIRFKYRDRLKERGERVGEDGKS